jgi:hypothetical protein
LQPAPMRANAIPVNSVNRPYPPDHTRPLGMTPEHPSFPLTSQTLRCPEVVR